MAHTLADRVPFSPLGGCCSGVLGLTGAGRGFCCEHLFLLIQNCLDEAQDEFLLGELFASAGCLLLQVGFDALE